MVSFHPCSWCGSPAKRRVFYFPWHFFPSMKKLSVEYRDVGDLLPYARNSRTHSEEQVAQIAGSIKEFGFTNPVLIDADGGIIAGHGRVMAARKLGLQQVPTIALLGLTEAQKRAYIIADNRLPLNAGWDADMLQVELSDLSAQGFDLDLLGFTADELADLLPDPEAGAAAGADPDEIPEPPENPISSAGEVWLLGKHRVMCGDSTSITDIEKLMDGNKPDMVFTDPPYGISIVSGSKVSGDKPFGSKKDRGTVGASNVVKANSYAPVAGDDSIDVALDAITIIKTLGASVEIIWGGNYYANALDNSSCWIVWDKQNSGNFADCELAWTNQKTAVRMFSHMWNGMIKASEHGQKRVHPTQKPVALAEWCFENYGEGCETVIDLFGGSGSTLIACEKVGKNAFLMELSPDYVDVIIRRWQDFTGKQATLEGDGRTFAEVEAERLME